MYMYRSRIVSDSCFGGNPYQLIVTNIQCIVFVYHVVYRKVCIVQMFAIWTHNKADIYANIIHGITMW